MTMCLGANFQLIVSNVSKISFEETRDDLNKKKGGGGIKRVRFSHRT